MRIGAHDPTSTELGLDVARRAGSAKATSLEQAAGVDTVSLSSDARSIHVDDAARAARIAEVRAQIESGGYPLDLAKLAERLVADELARGVF